MQWRFHGTSGLQASGLLPLISGVGVSQRRVAGGAGDGGPKLPGSQATALVAYPLAPPLGE